MRISRVTERLAQQTGITVNGDNPWDIRIHDERLYDRIWRDRSLGFGEAYMDGWWDCERVDALVTRLLQARADRAVGRNLVQRLHAVLCRICSGAVHSTRVRAKPLTSIRPSNAPCRAMVMALPPAGMAKVSCASIQPPRRGMLGTFPPKWGT